MTATDQMIAAAAKVLRKFDDEAYGEPGPVSAYHDEAEAILNAALAAMPSTPPAAQPVAAPDGRTASGETCLGMPVRAYVAREEFGDKFASHWSTLPKHQNPERLFAEADVRAMLAAQPVAVPVTLTYTNWRGETAERTIIPQSAWFGSTDWHPEPQWLLKAIDTEKGAERDFALKGFGTPQPVAVPDGWHYIPIPLNDAGNGPASPEETVKILHEVWDDTGSTVCTCRDEETARQIVTLATPPADTQAARITELEAENARLENEAVLRKAAYDGVGSLLLEVQQDCIAEHNRATTAEARITELEEEIACLNAELATINFDLEDLKELADLREHSKQMAESGQDDAEARAEAAGTIVTAQAARIAELEGENERLKADAKVMQEYAYKTNNTLAAWVYRAGAAEAELAALKGRTDEV